MILYRMRKLCTCCVTICVVHGRKPQLTCRCFHIHYTVSNRHFWLGAPSSHRKITPEECHMQGHHAMPQSSMRRYSRDDVFLQLQLQRTIRSKVLAGWRPETAQHREGQTPLQELTDSYFMAPKRQMCYPWSLHSTLPLR